MTEPLKDRSGEFLPRPVNPARRGSKRRYLALRPLSGLALAAIVVGGSTVFLLSTRPDGAQNLPAVRHDKRHAASTKRVQIAMAEGAGTTKASSEPVRPSLDFYTRGVRDSMFSAPQPPKPKETQTKPAKAPPAPKVPPVILNPFADWTYSGTVTMGDKRLALLENRTSKEGQYLEEGQTFMGAKVKSVTDQMVTLTSAGKAYPLAKSDEVDVTPLSSSAAYLTNQAQQQQANNQPAMGLQQAPDPSVANQQVVLPNGMVLSGNRAARFQQRMNNRFNGGGGRGGYGGGYGGRGGFGGRSGAFGGGPGGN